MYCSINDDQLSLINLTFLAVWRSGIVLCPDNDILIMIIRFWKELGEAFTTNQTAHLVLSPIIEPKSKSSYLLWHKHTDHLLLPPLSAHSPPHRLT
jgi:hypothetical protein